MKAGLTILPGRVIAGLLVGVSLLTAPPLPAAEKPQALIEQTVQDLLDQFTARREALESDQRALFALVDRVASPLFDFERITKLVLAQNWRRASARQRDEFRDEFRKLLIATYATALHKYSGDQRMEFNASKITERKGRKFAEIKSQVILADGAEPIAVVYSLMLDKADNWKIYNLTVGSLNMIVNYRKAYASLIGRHGLDGVLEKMKLSNAEHF